MLTWEKIPGTRDVNITIFVKSGGNGCACTSRGYWQFFSSHVIWVLLEARDDKLVFIICLTRANIWELVGKLCNCIQFIKSIFFLLQVMRKSVSVYYKSRENPYQVLQVTWESVSGTTSHVRIRIRYYKSRENLHHALHLNVQWNWKFVW